jgi:DNA-binding winged helix-turn-helix (wHTH) protein
MSDAEASLSFHGRHIPSWDPGHGGRESQGHFRVAEQGTQPLAPLMRVSAGLHDFDTSVSQPVQPPRGQLPFQPLTRSSFSFDSFCLIPVQRLLLERNQTVRIGSRALDLLIALVEQAGRILTKQDLTNRIWPNLFVEEHNLKVQMSVLRKALGDRRAGRRYVLTVPGRGYAFVAHVIHDDEPGSEVLSEWTKSGREAAAQGGEERQQLQRGGY